MDDDETVFVADDVNKLAKDVIDSVLSGSTYDHHKVNNWSAKISEQCLNTLSKLKKNFKYVVTCCIMQKTGAGLHTSSACFWDNTTDGTTTVRWDNRTMYCIVSVFGLGI